MNRLSCIRQAVVGAYGFVELFLTHLNYDKVVDLFETLIDYFIESMILL